MITKELLNQFYNAVDSDNLNHTHVCVYRFKSAHPKEYNLICAFHRKRTQLKKDVRIMTLYSENLYWFTLTFGNEKDKNLEASKRKESFSFLNSVFALFVLVEEHGEENGRYHIHGLGVFRENKGLEDFYKWHSREDIKLLETTQYGSKIHYLTNYMSKSVPRLRRNKRLSCLRRKTDKYFNPVFEKNFPSVAYNNQRQHLFDVDLMCLRG